MTKRKTFKCGKCEKTFPVGFAHNARSCGRGTKPARGGVHKTLRELFIGRFTLKSERGSRSNITSSYEAVVPSSQKPEEGRGMVELLTAEPTENTSASPSGLELNSDVAELILNEMPDVSETKPSVLPERLNQLAQEHGVKIDYMKLSPQALASHMGIILERVYQKQVERSHVNASSVLYVRGGELTQRIKNLRSNGNPEEVRKFKRELKEKYRFNPEYVEKLFTTNNKGSLTNHPVHLPDVIVIEEKVDGSVEIKCAEMKASGNNDSSSIPENVDKLMYGTRNSAMGPYVNRDDITIQRAIVLAATNSNKNSDGFSHKNKWEQEIKKRGQGNGEMEVFCNQEAFAWLSGKTISAEEYDQSASVSPALQGGVSEPS